MKASGSLRAAYAMGMLVANLAACNRQAADSAGQPTDTETQALVNDGSEVLTSSGQGESLGEIVFLGVSSQAPGQAASELAAPTQLWPVGCVERTLDPTNPLVVHVAFHDCSGPFGLVHLDGEEIVTLSEGAAGALHADFQGQALTANGRPLTHSASADITLSGAQRSIAYSGAHTRESSAGVTISHTSKLDITIDTSSRCVTSSGSAQTEIGTFEIDTEINGYEVCEHNDVVACPTGTVTHTAKASGKSITVDFDGTSEAQVTGPAGKTFDVQLVCGQPG